MIAGIWDSLSSQDVVNFVRYQVSEGKELTEIGEMICDHCLAQIGRASCRERVCMLV